MSNLLFYLMIGTSVLVSLAGVLGIIEQGSPKHGWSLVISLVLIVGAIFCKVFL